MTFVDAMIVSTKENHGLRPARSEVAGASAACVTWRCQPDGKPSTTPLAATQASSGSDCWGESFGSSGVPDDRYGNLTQISLTQSQCSGGTLSVSASSSTNELSASGFSYDAAGNMTGDGSYTYTFDAEDRIIQASGMSGGPCCYVYDGNGLRAGKRRQLRLSAEQGCRHAVLPLDLRRHDFGDERKRKHSERIRILRRSPDRVEQFSAPMRSTITTWTKWAARR